MLYGVVATWVLVAFVALPATLFALHPGGGSPVPALVGPFLLPCALVALAVSVVGVLRDKRRLLAIIAMTVSAVLTLFLLIAPDDVSLVMRLLCGGVLPRPPAYLPDSRLRKILPLRETVRR